MLKVPKILLLCSKGGEELRLREILGEHAWVTPIHSLTELREQAQQRQHNALLCGWSFHRR